MKNKSEYESKIKSFYIKEKKYLENLAKKIIKINYSLPLEADDLISYSFYILLKPEYKIKYFSEKVKNKNYTIELFIKSKLKFLMFSYCNLYKNKNHQILNFSLNLEENLKLENYNDDFTYSYEELFNFLTLIEFNVMYDIYVNKIKKIQIAKKLKISKFKLNKIEYKAFQKINKHYNNNKK